MRSRIAFWFLLIIFASVGGLFLSEKGGTRGFESIAMKVVAPAQSAITYAISPFRGVFSTITHLRDLERENEARRDEVAALKSEIVRLREVDIENKRLKDLLGYKDHNPDWKYLNARVIGGGPNNLVQTITIDKGKANGLQEGMTVVASGGLVGKITDVWDNASRVLLLIDPNSSVNAMVQRSRALGVVIGQPGRHITMEYVAQGESVEPGDMVMTSGFGGGFPKGVLIGQVADIGGSDLEVFQQLRLVPAVRFQDLEEVMVITNFTPIKIPG